MNNSDKNPLIISKEAVVATKSILDDVIPQLEGIAEHSRNELRSARLILSDALDEMKNLQVKGKFCLHVVQFEHGGIPDEPLVTFNLTTALDVYQQHLLNQGFRKLKDNEYLGDYIEEYDNLLSGYFLDEYPKFKPDDTVRWWKIQLS